MVRARISNLSWYHCNKFK